MAREEVLNSPYGDPFFVNADAMNSPTVLHLTSISAGIINDPSTPENEAMEVGLFLASLQQPIRNLVVRVESVEDFLEMREARGRVVALDVDEERERAMIKVSEYFSLIPDNEKEALIKELASDVRDLIFKTYPPKSA